MQYGGKPRKITLTTDLTKYDSRCTIGQKGETVPEYKCGFWGTQEDFVAVQFDCGALLDVSLSSLKFD